MSAKELLKKSIRKISVRLFNRIRYRKLATIDKEHVRKFQLEPELLLLRNILSGNGYFFDIGANVGEYLYVASTLIDEKLIFGFEPNVDLYRELKQSFPKATILPVALSKGNDGVKPFKIPSINGQEFESRGTLNIDNIEQQESGHRLLQVEVRSIDSIVSEYRISKLDLIKIDVEGHEIPAIQGASDTLDRLRPFLIIEIEQRHHKVDINTFINSILEFGYHCYYLDGKTYSKVKLESDARLLQPIELHGKHGTYINNFVFVPIEKLPLMEASKAV